MTVSPGSRLGPYEIVSRIGAGGMGEVFKARDTRLDRSVAIKVLPAEFAHNTQLKVRFEREAKTISQLNHPHICTLHDVGHDSGTDYLVMELLEGESLADRLSRGALPLEQLLKMGIEIADALERAHRQSVVHRDLKPGNIMLTKSGAKLLDFGLAKPSGFRSSANEATAIMDQKPLTAEGTIVGTFQYMAPEQIEGRDADARSDIFALGAVLYEAATGKRAFDGKSRASVIASILDRDPPPISTLQPMTPPSLEHIIAKCLDKDPDARWQSAHDVAEDLRWIGAQRGDDVVRTRAGSKRWKIASALLALVAIAATAFAYIARRDAARKTHMELSIAVPSLSYVDEMVISPDGTRVVFNGTNGSQRQLWVRAIDSSAARPLEGTGRADYPFWSPDGKQIGFFAGGKLKRIPAAGGPVQVICDAPESFGGSWSKGGTILFGSAVLGPIERVDANGGTPKAVTKVSPREEAHRWPQFLPDGDHFLFLGDASRTEDHHLKIGSVASGETRDLTQAISNVRYAQGTIFYVRGLSLMAQPFDEKRLAFVGEAQVVAEQIVSDGDNHHYDFSVSDDGAMTFRSGTLNSRLTWVDRNGRSPQVISEAFLSGEFDVAADEKSIAMTKMDADTRPDDIWLRDVAHGAERRITSDPAGDYAPVFSPDAKSLAFASMRAGLGDVFVIDDVNQNSDARLLVKTKDGGDPTSWTRDGEVLFNRFSGSDIDIWICSAKSGASRPYIATRFTESNAIVSPDGAWVAYESRESGRTQVVIEQFPSHAARRQVSIDGGNSPRWRKDGKELFFRAPDLNVMSLDMTVENASPKILFYHPGYSFRPSADGQRFLIDDPLIDMAKVPETFVSDWHARLKEK